MASESADGPLKRRMDPVTTLSEIEVFLSRNVCQRGEETPGKISNPRARLMGQANTLKDRKVGVEKPSPLFMCRLWEEIIHPKRNSCVREGVAVRIS